MEKKHCPEISEELLSFCGKHSHRDFHINCLGALNLFSEMCD